jgi:hypothetical protein
MAILFAVLRRADAGAPKRVRALFAFEGTVVLLKEVGPRELVATFRVHLRPGLPWPKFVILPVTAAPGDVRLGASYLVRAVADETPKCTEAADRTVRTLHDADVELTEIRARSAAA